MAEHAGTPAAGPPAWDVWALRLGSAERPARDNFLMPCARNGAMRLDFTMWVARDGDRVVVVDTGFSERAGEKRGRHLDLRPAQAVRRLGIAPEQVGEVVLTHLHFDHAGNIGDFPQAKVTVQAGELEYTTGKAMTRPALSHFFEADDVVDVVRRVHDGRVRVAEGDVELAPGLELCLIGGHTKGLQAVRVHTGRGWVVLASDALHYYANFHERNPFPAILDLGVMLDGYDRIGRLAESEDHIVPGHDPAVFERYADPRDDLPDGTVALHRAPRQVSAS
ncbi:N-acyl homoserine lactonase family protein [Spirillospora sp. CA-128828]|uniref:N-acyl homoserine lactonase family protein n=1 Tax=Spirillospora sp. CA-128828 TaxID=3240033 RepID=UPI003D8C013B